MYRDCVLIPAALGTSLICGPLQPTWPVVSRNIFKISIMPTTWLNKWWSFKSKKTTCESPNLTSMLVHCGILGNHRTKVEMYKTWRQESLMLIMFLMLFLWRMEKFKEKWNWTLTFVLLLLWDYSWFSGLTLKHVKSAEQSCICKKGLRQS